MMGEENKYRQVYLSMPDGSLRLMELQDVNVIADETIVPGDIAIDRIDANGIFCGTLTLRKPFKKRLMRVLYGWTARGHIRHRVLDRLWEQEARECSGI